MSEPKPLLLRASEIAEKAQTFSHPWNPASLLSGTQMGRLVGLKRTGVSLARIPPGKESFVYHTHVGEEEFIYILSGRGIAEIGDKEFEVKTGDFMGFPAPSVGHHLRNPFDADLLYLMGGERHEIEVGDYPRLRKRGVRTGTEMQLIEWANLDPFWK